MKQRDEKKGGCARALPKAISEHMGAEPQGRACGVVIRRCREEEVNAAVWAPATLRGGR